MQYDVIIIGTGPAGYTAAIYCSRYNLKTAIIGKEPGGMAATAHKVENWPGEISLSGSDLMEKFKSHVKNFNVEIIDSQVKKITKNNNTFTIYLNNNEIIAKSIILAVGTKHRNLNIEGEKEFLGKGVSYCSTCDGAFFKNKKVAIIGGGNSAFMAANQLSDIAKTVYLIYIDEKPLAMPSWVQRVTAKKNVTIIPKNTVVKIIGNKFVEKIQLKENFNNNDLLEIDGVFVEIGSIPNDHLIANLGIKTNDKKYMIVDNTQKTNIDGVFAAGDITTNSNGFAQIITASAEGAISALSAYKYIKNN